jgi:cyclopropane fatty-acyl-phospholipid synthase-like methyltransferase
MGSTGADDIERFAERYAASGADAMLAAEIDALGSDYQANGYTTMDQAIELGRILHIEKGQILLDAGSGCGWPGVFLARRHGCAVVSLDPVSDGATAAQARGAVDGIAEQTWPVLASADAIPIRSGAVDAIVHADLMC